MAKYLFDIPDDIDNRVISAFARAHGYMPLLASGDANPETKKAFMIRKIQEFVMESAINAEVQDEAEKARDVALAKARREIKVT